ncbi:MAG TPA: DUF2461 domain-containing protein [Candidatus Dormibacteraeota bacterium]|nr:DUF2461 domain-containing protein [Candidatus Dormibacteraeota bacterium]
MTARADPAIRSRFAGWPKPALQFFQGLKRDNSKAYFEAHRQVYEEQVRQPMDALLVELEKDLGPDAEVKIFRLNRDLRFSPDKRPYKEHLGAYLSSPRAGGVYLQFSNDGVYIAIGSHEMAPDQLTRFRDAVAGKEGEKLARIVAALVKDGYQVTEPSFKRVPPGYPADHPRGDLLRCKGLMAGRNWKPGPWLRTVEAKERLRQAIKDSKALTIWLDVHVGPSREPARPTR